MYKDSSGHGIGTVLLIILGIAITAATAVGVGEVVAYHNAPKVFEEYKDKIAINGNQITNSSLVKNPFDMWAISSYIKHYSDQGVQGTAFGLAFEWICHNVAYDATQHKNDAFKHVDFGKTIISDLYVHTSGKERFASILMNGFDFLFSPITYVYEFVQHIKEV